MSLLRSFPEIDRFFISNKFTEAELNIFLLETEKKYLDKDLRKAALNLINLELAKFQIVKDNVDLKPLTKTSQAQKVKPAPKNEYHELKKLTISLLAERLHWRAERLITLLSQKGLNKTGEEILVGNEFNEVKEMIISRLKAVQRMKKEKKLKERGRIKNYKNEKSLSPRNDVYSKIEEIGLGKVIYIRKK